MKKVYLAHPISTTGEFHDSKRVANRISAIERWGEFVGDEDAMIEALKRYAHN